MPVQSSQEVITADLDAICTEAAPEFEQLSGRRLLITGGAGFLGYYLVQSVLHWNRTTASHIELTLFDNFQRGVPRWLSTLQGEPHFTVEQRNVAAPLPAAVGAFDYIIHAASVASPTHYRLHPLETMDANVLGLRSLLERSVAGSGVQGLLVFSSSEIYGDPPATDIPTPETYRGNVSCIGPRACYDESKRYGETLAVIFARHYGAPVKIVRPFNNYGPGMRLDDRRLIADLARNVIAGEDLVLYSDGAATRTFCYVADAVGGYLKVLVRGRVAEPYNIGVESPEISIAEFAARIQSVAHDAFGYKGSVTHRSSSDRDYTVDNPVRRCPSITKAATELEYRPMTPLDDGLRRTLVWYRDGLGET